MKKSLIFLVVNVAAALLARWLESRSQRELPKEEKPL